jgi:hypothetical protein
VVTCDPEDDVVDNLSSLAVGIAMKYAKNTYNEPHWKFFYEALCMLFECEDLLNERLKENERETLRQETIKMGPIQVVLGGYADSERTQSCTINELSSLDTADNEKNEALLIKR